MTDASAAMVDRGFLGEVTPVILTYNEAANIGRCLSNLTWARSIVVVDSGSTDETAAICAADPRVLLHVRPFDSHAAQWSHAVHDTGVKTEWVLALDADYMLTPAVSLELAQLRPSEADAAYSAPFVYAILGKVLRSGIYPPVPVLYRRSRGRYVQDGHTQRLVVDGETHRLAAPLIHDDRKSFARWLEAQKRYAVLEAAKDEQAAGGLKTWLRRRTPFSPVVVGLYCLIVRGGLFEGRAGWLYAAQRMLAEALVLSTTLDRELRSR